MKVLQSLRPDTHSPFGNITNGLEPGFKKLQASVLSVSELQSNPIYISARIRICSTRVNLNKQAVTKEFIEEVVVNKANYIGLPLYADTRRLIAKDYKRLGHLYDPSSGKFYTDQIGTFVDFEVLEDEFGTSLIGEVRISKRNEEICEAIVELFSTGSLKISFEIFYADFTKDANGVLIINKSDNNRLVSACVVTIPAYPEASALALVAEKDDLVDLSKINASEYIASEVSLDTLVSWFYEYLSMMDLINDVQIERIGPDFAILYFIRDGKTYKLDFAVAPSGLDIIAFYEIEFVRKLETKGIDYMSNAEKIKAEKNQKDAEIDVREGIVEVSNSEVAEVVILPTEETITNEPELVQSDVTSASECGEAENTVAINSEGSVDVAESAEIVVVESPAVDGAKPIENESIKNEPIKNEPITLESLASYIAELKEAIAPILALISNSNAAVVPVVEAVVEGSVATASEQVIKVDATDKGDQFQGNVEEAEARMLENRELMTQLAEARGFNIQEAAVAKAIQALDYKSLLECDNTVVSAASTLNGMVDDINISGNKHPALEKA